MNEQDMQQPKVQSMIKTTNNYNLRCQKTRVFMNFIEFLCPSRDRTCNVSCYAIQIKARSALWGKIGLGFNSCFGHNRMHNELGLASISVQ